MTELVTILDRIVARAAPGEGVEAFGIDETDTTVSAYGGQVESLSSARTRGVGIRVVDGGRVGYAYTADLGEAALADALDEARANAAVGTPDDANRLPEGGDLPDLPELYDPAFADATTEEKVDVALRLEAAARAGDRIKGIDTARYGDGVRTAAIASTTGVRGAYRRADAYVMVEALAEADGATTSAYGLDVARTPAGLDVEAAATEAAMRAARLLGGRKPPSARIPIVLDPFTTASLLGVLAGGLVAEAVQKGRSLFAGKVGERLGADHLTLIDDGRLLDGLSTAPWDGEGVPTGRTELVAAGILTRFLHNTYSATKDGVASTGNASRSGFKSPPGVRPSNLYIEPGPDTPDALLARAGTAFYCQQIMGVHSGANPVTGDVSVGAAGLMVRDGAFAEPVREASIAGTIPGMLGGIVAVGADLRFLPLGGGMGGATLLVEGMTLSGA
ncbi:MAG TPA: TldD/PmbA family protein [Egibacteraceae bacterium]|jgi:PmbA protein|nr:TldD/PmbA family protein [Egibacteraceae bacterium]